MKQHAIATPVRGKTNGPVLQRKCGCGTHTIGGGTCSTCQKQAAFQLGPADDEHEREAERVAGQVMRYEPRGTSGIASSAAAPSPVTIRRLSATAAIAPQIDFSVDRQIRAAQGSGDSLPAEALDFFEPRFGRDFSSVRVHHEPESAVLAQRLGAEAFTVGHDIFFNSHRYQPTSRAGMHLLAHELTHVAQQQAGAPPAVRRKIGYQQISWSNFKGKPDATSSLTALTQSGIAFPNWSSTKKDNPTGVDCQRGRRADKEYEATVFIDPDIYNDVKAEMDEDNSWAKEQVTSPSDFCSKSKATECQQFFAGGNKSSFSLTYKGNAYATAKSSAECTAASFQDPCLRRANDRRTNLIKHEQGHFDISNVIAEKAKADMKAKAAGFTATAKACGRIPARNAAQTKFNALNAGTELSNRQGDWLTLRQKATDDYDAPTETDHGDDAKKQAAWEADIKAKLPKYDLNPPPVAPATPAPTGTPAPTTLTPGTPTPGTPTPGTPAPKQQSTGTDTESEGEP